MSSDTATLDGVTRQCDWPGCPAGFTGVRPVSPGWRHVPLASFVSIVLCPFHAVDHVPSLAPSALGVRATCSCGELRIPLPRRGVAVAIQDWRTHIRAVNGPDDRVGCPECIRDFEPHPSGLVRKHNALDMVHGVLLPSQCPGSGQVPRVLVAR